MLLTRTKLGRTLASGLLVAALGAVASCDCESCKTPTTTKDTGDKPAPNTPANDSKPVVADNAPTPDAVYVARGEVAELPDPKDPSREFQIRHEAIDNFKQTDGRLTGMDSMTMFFPLKDDSLIAGLKVGDKVEFTFEHFYKPRQKYYISKIVKLPADTKLEFREANPPK